MNGCQHEQKSFSVSMSHAAIALCEKCGHSITDRIRKFNHSIVCKECWDEIKPLSDGIGSVDNFFGYYDQQLGVKITSVRQKVRLLEKRGLHYSEDNPRFRDNRKLAESYLGRDGKKKLDENAKKEFISVTQKMARRAYGR